MGNTVRGLKQRPAVLARFTRVVYTIHSTNCSDSDLCIRLLGYIEEFR